PADRASHGPVLPDCKAWARSCPELERNRASGKPGTTAVSSSCALKFRLSSGFAGLCSAPVVVTGAGRSRCRVAAVAWLCGATTSRVALQASNANAVAKTKRGDLLDADMLKSSGARRGVSRGCAATDFDR